MNIIAQNITRRRKELNMTQKELAEQLNISDKTVSRWETGIQIPDALVIPELAKCLQITIDELYGVNMTEQIKTTETPNIEYGKITAFKVTLLISVFAYFLISCIHILPFGEITMGMVLIGQMIALVVIQIVFHEWYLRKANTEHYDVENLKWFGLAILITDFVMCVWIPLVKNYNYNRNLPMLWISVFTVTNIVLMFGSIAYRRKFGKREFSILWKEMRLPILVGILGILVVISYGLYVYQPIKAGFGPDSMLRDNRMRLLEVVAGLLFVLMQVVNYVLVLRARTQRSMNEKMKNRVATVLLVVILATIGVIVASYMQKSLYNEFSQQVYNEKKSDVSIYRISVGIDFGLGQNTYTYLTLEEEDHIEQLFDILRKVKIQKGKAAKEENGKSCRIRFESANATEEEETISWDVTLYESGVMWYQGDEYEIVNTVDWNELFRLAITEYNGLNKEFYEEMLE